MHNRSACKVECSKIVQPATCTPDPMCNRIVYERCPEKHKDNKCAKAYALSKGANDQSRSDNGKHGLKDHIGQMRNGWCISGIRCVTYSTQTKEIESSNHTPYILAKDQAVSNHYPLQT